MDSRRSVLTTFAGCVFVAGASAAASVASGSAFYGFIIAVFAAVGGIMIGFSRR